MMTLEQIYVEEQKEIEHMKQTQQPPWLVNNIIFCCDAEKQTKNGNKRKQHFLQHKENHSNNKKNYIDGSKSTGRKVGFSAVFQDFTTREALPDDAEMTAIKIAMREIQEREEMIWLICTEKIIQ